MPGSKNIMFSKLNTAPGTAQLGEHSPPYHIRGVTKMVANPSISTG